MFHMRPTSDNSRVSTLQGGGESALGSERGGGFDQRERTH